MRFRLEHAEHMHQRERVMGEREGGKRRVAAPSPATLFGRVVNQRTSVTVKDKNSAII